MPIRPKDKGKGGVDPLNIQGGMSALRHQDPFPVALCCADIHLSHKAPAARAEESNWYSVMGRAFSALHLLWTGFLTKGHRLPILISGDLFHTYDVVPELINFALKQLTFGEQIYAIPGQHDLPHHRLDDVEKSAFWTLVQAQRVQFPRPGEVVTIDGKMPISIYSFPWGVPIHPLKKPQPVGLNIALVHDYYWKRGAGFEGAPQEKNIDQVNRKFEGYDVIVFGDNHQPWQDRVYDACRCHLFTLYNCGCFIRRRSDERNIKPSIGIIYSDGEVKRHYLDVSQDVFSDEPEEKKTFAGIDVAELKKLMNDATGEEPDFDELVKRFVMKTPSLRSGVVRIIKEILEEQRRDR